jgi:hypothetical protein
MKTFVIILVMLLSLSMAGHAQCSDDVYELTLSETGRDVVLVRDFKIKLDEGNKRNPNPVSKYNVLMQEGLTYRFSVATYKNAPTEPILQLFDKNELLGESGKPEKNQNTKKLDFLCKHSGKYQVVISFGGKGGCAIGFMAMVTDSSFFAMGYKKPVDERYLIYAGVPTPLHLITDNTDVVREDVTISEGKIEKKDNMYLALVANPGEVTLVVKLYNKHDSIVESTEQKFAVIPLPDPSFSIEGVEHDFINTELIGSTLNLIITPNVYRVLEFYLSTELEYHSGLRSDNERFTPEMISFLKSLPSQQRFYIKDIQVIGPNGTMTFNGPYQFYTR